MDKIKYLLAGVFLGTLLSSTAFAEPAREFMLKLVDYPVLVGGEEYVDEELPFLNYNDRTYVPLKSVGEMLDLEIEWNEEQRRVEIGVPGELMPESDEPEDPEAEPDEPEEPVTDEETPAVDGESFSFRGISPGDPETQVHELLGVPARQDLSKYGFYWHIYNHNYNDYLQVGIENEQVVALFSNSGNWQFPEDLPALTNGAEVKNALGEPLEYIRKGDARFIIKDEKTDTYLLDGYYVTFHYDLLDGQSVDAIKLVKQETEEALQQFFAPCSPELRDAYARQIFDLTNVFRLRHGLETLAWCDQAAALAREHSRDMVERDFFSHFCPDGRSPFDRLSDGGVEHTEAAENIAARQTNGIGAYHHWINSYWHRTDGMLGNYEMSGIGVACDAAAMPYYTQKFYTRA